MKFCQHKQCFNLYLFVFQREIANLIKRKICTSLCDYFDLYYAGETQICGVFTQGCWLLSLSLCIMLNVTWHIYKTAGLGKN